MPILSVVLVACGGGASDVETKPGDDDDDDVELACVDYGDVEAVGSVDVPLLTEASGLALGDDVLFAHNDSGDIARVFAFGFDGSSMGQFRLDRPAYDIEDLAAGPDGLVLADFGDNYRERDVVKLYTFDLPEPDPSDGSQIVDSSVQTLTYEDEPHDAEGLLVDPITGEPWVLTKETDGISGIYGVDGDTLVREGSLDLNAVDAVNTLVTGVDARGGRISVRTYADVFVWLWPDDLSLVEALQEEPCPGTPAPFEVQGESIALDAEGVGYYTVSEGNAPDINYVGPAR